MTTPFTHVDVLAKAREYVLAGGDPAPCALGAFCLRCCLTKAKGLLDDEHDTRLPPSEVMLDLAQGFFGTRPTDKPLVDAVKLVAVYDDGLRHTQGTALTVLDFVLRDAAAAERGAGI